MNHNCTCGRDINEPDKWIKLDELGQKLTNLAIEIDKWYNKNWSGYVEISTLILESKDLVNQLKSQMIKDSRAK